MECMLTVIYGFNTVEQRRSLWKGIKQLDTSINMPWILGGDFSTVTSLQDRLIGNPVVIYRD